jgi:DNA-binding transcriptional LysR family regulator
MDISLGKLQQLVAVADSGSFSKAAVELSISQPALSRSIADIERRYGFQIFNRSGHFRQRQSIWPNFKAA